jgi:hypothetical protein
MKPDFGSYVEIEMNRYGVSNELYLHKIIGRFQSSHSATVPIAYGLGCTGHDEVSHGGMEKSLRVIQCGVTEDKVFIVKESDCSLVAPAYAKQHIG